MNPVRFTDGTNSIEISASVERDDSLPSVGDAYLVVAINSNGFVGRNDLWVQREALVKFRDDLVVLDKSLKGSAKLESISPDELELHIHNVSSRGHIAVSGSTGYSVPSENAKFWHAVSFGLEFERGQLAAAITESWLQHYEAKPIARAGLHPRGT